MSSVLTSPPSASSAAPRPLSTGLELRWRPRRSASCGPRRRSRRSACPGWRPACARPRGRTGRSGWCRRRSSCRPTAPRPAGALAAFLALDGRDDAGRALEVEERLLELRVDDVAVGHHQHRVEDLLVLGVVQLGEEVRRPGDGVGLARARRVLDEVLAAGPVAQHRGLELAGHVELVEAREDEPDDLLLLVALGDEVAAEDLEPALARPDLLPQVRRAVPPAGSPGCRRRRRRPG
jgi:hypothetical protein